MARLSWRVRWAILGIMTLAGITIYFTNALLTERFTASTQQRAQLRLALYSGNLISELQRNSIVPRLLASDPELIGALASNDFQQTSQRLLSFVDEIGAAGIMLLDIDGRVVAATDRLRLGQFHKDAPYFIQALRSNETVFTTTPSLEIGELDFAYSRSVVANQMRLGVVVVEADLRKFETAWRGISDAVIVTDSTGQIILTTEQSWLGLNEAEALSRRSAPNAIQRALEATQGWGNTGADAYVQGQAVMRQDLRVPFQGWTMAVFTTYGGVRQRVNAAIALVVMGFAIFLSLAFYQLSRRSLTRAVIL
ncbi:MAG: cache domain-containing protein, partial [Pseudomonadota bacterium]